MSYEFLQILWFILVAVLWIGFYFFEGFDFGVGMLLPILGKKDEERRAIMNTIGSVWDGNEVWLLTAGGATFAAFPHWYATMFSGFYLPLFLLLVGLLIPFGLIGGLTTVAVFLLHGANFLSLKLDGELRERARELSKNLYILAAVMVVLLAVT